MADSFNELSGGLQWLPRRACHNSNPDKYFALRKERHIKNGLVQWHVHLMISLLTSEAKKFAMG